MKTTLNQFLSTLASDSMTLNEVKDLISAYYRAKDNSLHQNVHLTAMISDWLGEDAEEDIDSTANSFVSGIQYTKLFDNESKWRQPPVVSRNTADKSEVFPEISNEFSHLGWNETVDTELDQYIEIDSASSSRALTGSISNNSINSKKSKKQSKKVAKKKNRKSKV